MPDHMTPEQRRRAMIGNKSKNTKPEVVLRSALHHAGLRFRKHVKALPGTPDAVFTRAKIVVFIDGDFWHGHRFKSWENRLRSKWHEKITSNRSRDCKNFKMLRAMGWQVIRVWEHDINKSLVESVERVHTAYTKRILKKKLDAHRK